MTLDLLAKMGECFPIVGLFLAILGIMIRNHFTHGDAVKRIGILEGKVEVIEDKAEAQYLQIMLELAHIKTMLGMIVKVKD